MCAGCVRVSFKVSFKVVRFRVSLRSVCSELGLHAIGDGGMRDWDCGQCVLIGDMDVSNVICSDGV
jgi:hypothetical protein